VLLLVDVDVNDETRDDVVFSRRSSELTWHPRTGITTFLLYLSTSTELVVFNPISLHDPHPDPQLASHRCSRFPETLLD
jgi:hypothetical protein